MKHFTTNTAPPLPLARYLGLIAGAAAILAPLLPIKANGFGLRLRESLPVSEPSLLAVGDLDADGNLEIVMMDRPAGRIVIYEKEGAILLPRFTIEEPTMVRGAWVGDIDGDNTPEIVSGNLQGRIRIFEASANDTYAERHSSSGIIYIENSVGGESDGDGLGELLVAQEGSPTRLRIFESDGADGYLEQPSHLGTGGNASVAGAADLDGDGIPEAVFNDDARQEGVIRKVYVFENGTPVHIDERMFAHSIGDTDGNGLGELIGYEIGTENLRIIESTGIDNEFREVFNSPAPGYSAVGIDVDQDGVLELVKSEGNSLTIAKRIGGRLIEVFRSQHLRGNPGRVRNVVPILGAKTSCDPSLALLQNGKVHLFDHVTDYHLRESLSIREPSLVAAGDLDDDGILDLAVMDQSAGRLVILEKEGGVLVPRFTINEPTMLRGAFVGDIDGDATPEIVSGNLQGRIRIFEAVANDTYELRHSSGGIIYIENSTAGDSDGDGLGELLVAQEGWPTKLRIFESDGNNGYSEQASYSGRGGNAGVPGTADLDGDGAPETVFHDDGGRQGVERNAYIFENDSLIHTDTRMFAHSLGDTDGNGLGELIGYDRETENLRVLESTGSNNEYELVFDAPAPGYRARIVQIDHRHPNFVKLEGNTLTLARRCGGQLVKTFCTGDLLKGDAQRIANVVPLLSYGPPALAALQGSVVHIFDSAPPITSYQFNAQLAQSVPELHAEAGESLSGSFSYHPGALSIPGPPHGFAPGGTQATFPALTFELNGVPLESPLITIYFTSGTNQYVHVSGTLGGRPIFIELGHHGNDLFPGDDLRVLDQIRHEDFDERAAVYAGLGNRVGEVTALDSTSIRWTKELRLDEVVRQDPDSLLLRWSGGDGTSDIQVSLDGIHFTTILHDVCSPVIVPIDPQQARTLLLRVVEP